MNFSELKNRVHELLENRTDLIDKIGNWINDTRKDLATEFEFTHLYTYTTVDTSAGTDLYDLPNDYIYIQSVWLEEKPLMKLSLTEEGMLYTDGTMTGQERIYLPFTTLNASGAPEYYFLEGEKIKLIPIPNDTYSIRINYYSQPDDFVDDSDSDAMSRLHFDAIIYGAALRGANFLDDVDKMNRFAVLYSKSVQKLLLRERRLKEMNRVVRIRTPEDLDYLTALRYFKVVR